MSGDGSELLKTLAKELGKVPNKMAIEGHTDSKPYPPTATYTNWELSADRANAARRFMEQGGLQSGQVTQVRGFADQRLRKPDPLDPSNRPISLIVQCESKASSQAPSAEDAKPEGQSETSGKEDHANVPKPSTDPKKE
jgi:chemotaxis protein MotB